MERWNEETCERETATDKKLMFMKEKLFIEWNGDLEGK